MDQEIIDDSDVNRETRNLGQKEIEYLDSQVMSSDIAGFLSNEIPSLDDEQRELIEQKLKGFLSERFEEGFRVLNAARSLRDQFYLTPKPTIKWRERKDKGCNITVGDVLGSHGPDNPNRD